MNLTEMRWIKTMSKNSRIDRINELKEQTNDGTNEWIYEGCFSLKNLQRINCMSELMIEIDFVAVSWMEWMNLKNCTNKLN